jgi:amino acid transporter
MHDWAQQVARIVVGAIILQMAYMLLDYTLNTYVVSEAAVGKVHTETFVPYLMAALGIIGLSCTIRRNEVHRTKWVLLACVAIAFFAMSLRTINFYAADGEIYETTPIVDIDGGTLDGLNDETYCYKRNFPFIDLRPS